MQQRIPAPVPPASPEPPDRALHLTFLLLALAATAFRESFYLHHWLNPVDEGWPLYAAMRLHRGGALYQDAFFVFPPGHALAAWIGYGVDPPGVIAARLLYAVFNVALGGTVYLLGRRVMPAPWALLGALLLAFAAPFSHRTQLLFGYRYLVWSALALLAFGQRLRTGDLRWMFASGCLAGTALCFRLTPAFAVSLGIGLGVMAAGTDPRRWLRDWASYALGLLLIAAPVVAWFVAQLGADAFWREVVVRPVVMTNLQSLPVPELALPLTWQREKIHDAFVSFLFRGVAVLYLIYAAVLFGRWARRALRGQRFEQPMLLAIVVWGGVYFLRSLGRSDEPHLASAIPPFCLLMAHALRTTLARLTTRLAVPSKLRRSASVIAGTGLLAAWVLLLGSDRVFDPEFRGTVPFEPMAEDIWMAQDNWLHTLGPVLEAIRELAPPDRPILDLSAWSMLYVLADRPGPGYADIIMPGTFLHDDEERAFVARLEADPPALVTLGVRPFDNDRSRSVAHTAPRVIEWVSHRYGVVGDPEDYLLLAPRARRELRGPPRAGDPPAASSPVAGFWRSDADAARRHSGLEPLDPSDPLDRSLLELLQDTSRHQVTDLLTRAEAIQPALGWGRGVGSFAHPTLGIGIDRRLREIAARNAANRKLFLEAVRCLLAQQLARLLQLREYTLESLSRPENQALAEAQTVILAGMILSQNVMMSGRSWGPLRPALQTALAWSATLRPAPWYAGFELASAERRALLRLGVEAGILYGHGFTCVTNRGEPGSEKIMKWLKPAATATASDVRRIFAPRGPESLQFPVRPDSVPLPRLDLETCQVESTIDWSEAAARSLLASREPAALPGS